MLNNPFWNTVAYLICFTILLWNLYELRDSKRTLRQHLHSLGFFLFVITVYLVNILHVLSDILKKMH
jgi:hypothetical protein